MKIILIFLFSFSALAIIDGQTIDRNSLYEKFNVSWNIEGNHFCSGVIISRKHILTAGHCVGDKKFQVSLGVSQKQILVKNVYLHPDYTSYRMQMPYPNGKVNDLAILELVQSIPKTYIPIPIYQNVTPGGSVFLLGYGKSEPNGSMGTLRIKKLKIVDYLVESGEWVTERGACGGDSGGALIYVNNKQINLIGITSRADKRNVGAGCLGQSIQTDLIYQTWWINQFI